jgi:membrane fusion protein (multidrug efflux system)
MVLQTDEQEHTTGLARSWRRRLVPLVIVVVAVALVVLVALIPDEPEPLPDNGIPPTNVIVQTIQPIPELADTFTLSAIVEPESVVRVAAEVAGRVERYGNRVKPVSWRGRDIPAGKVIEEGEPIEPNEPIVFLNADLLLARYQRADAQFKYDDSEWTRISELYEREATSQTELDDARANRAVSAAMLEEARRNLERAKIVAPIGGILNRLTVEIGEYASPGQQVAEIVNIDRVRVVVEVPERDIYYLHLGDSADVFVDALQETRLSGEVTYISELADEFTRTTRVEITADNRDHQLRSGQIVRARLTRRMLTNAIMIPLGSVIPLEQGRVVYIANGDHAERREVELGLIEGRRVQILSGLAPGDRLIVAGHRYVGPGQPVTVVEERPAGQQGQDTAATSSHVVTTPGTP